MGVASTDQTPRVSSRRAASRVGTTTPARAPRVGRLEAPPVTLVTHTVAGHALGDVATELVAPQPARPRVPQDASVSIGSATALPALPYASPRATPGLDPDVWLIGLVTSGGGLQALEGAGRAGAIRVGRPYGHLRSVRPVALSPLDDEMPAPARAAATPRRARSSKKLDDASEPATTTLPAARPLPAVVAAVEIETDAGLFRVERRGSVLAHSDLAWALAHLEAGEPDSVVPLPRRQLALLLTLLPTPENPAHPELDPVWGWAHRLRGPWERGPLHSRGRLGRLIAFDPDGSGRGAHRACFELLGSEEIVWAVGVPCFRTGSVYELIPLGKGLSPSRWLTWPLSKGRKRTAADERPAWEIARVVYRVGAPRWPLAGVVEPLGPMGVAG